MPTASKSKLINSAQERLRNKLCQLDPNSLEISDYNARYLKDKLLNIDEILELYGTLLCLCLADQSKPFSQCTIVDYGGGIGVLSLLALEAGVGNVVYNDIFDVSCSDVAKLSSALEMKIPHIVCGDVEDLLDAIVTRSLRIDGIVSYDVLEHIYDVRAHFSTIHARLRNPAKLVYGSGANSRNPKIVRSLGKIHNEVEHVDRDKNPSDKSRDSSQSYLTIRKRLISESSPQLTEKEVVRLASATRGLNTGDIRRVVADYVETGHVSFPINHPTNTCDPLTGNWCEHLIDLGWLKSELEGIGYSVKIHPGIYHTYRTDIKSCIKRLLNSIIAIFDYQGLIVAPYYVVEACTVERRNAISGIH